MLVLYTQPSFSSFISRFCLSKSSTLLSCRAVSRLGKRPTALLIDSSTGGLLPPRGNSAQKFQGLEVLSFQDSIRATHEGIRQCHAKISSQRPQKFCPTAEKVPMHLHEHVLNGSQAKEFPETFLQEQGSNAS
jgi:hypothetical protein